MGRQAWGTEKCHTHEGVQCSLPGKKGVCGRGRRLVKARWGHMVHASQRKRVGQGVGKVPDLITGLHTSQREPDDSISHGQCPCPSQVNTSVRGSKD